MCCTNCYVSAAFSEPVFIFSKQLKNWSHFLVLKYFVILLIHFFFSYLMVICDGDGGSVQSTVR